MEEINTNKTQKEIEPDISEYLDFDGKPSSERILDALSEMEAFNLEEKYDRIPLLVTLLDRIHQENGENIIPHLALASSMEKGKTALRSLHTQLEAVTTDSDLAEFISSVRANRGYNPVQLSEILMEAAASPYYGTKTHKAIGEVLNSNPAFKETKDQDAYAHNKALLADYYVEMTSKFYDETHDPKIIQDMRRTIENYINVSELKGALYKALQYIDKIHPGWEKDEKYIKDFKLTNFSGIRTYYADDIKAYKDKGDAFIYQRTNGTAIVLDAVSGNSTIRSAAQLKQLQSILAASYPKIAEEKNKTELHAETKKIAEPELKKENTLVEKKPAESNQGKRDYDFKQQNQLVKQATEATRASFKGKIGKNIDAAVNAAGAKAAKQYCYDIISQDYFNFKELNIRQISSILTELYNGQTIENEDTNKTAMFTGELINAGLAKIGTYLKYRKEDPENNSPSSTQTLDAMQNILEFTYAAYKNQGAEDNDQGLQSLVKNAKIIQADRVEAETLEKTAREEKRKKENLNTVQPTRVKTLARGEKIIPTEMKEENRRKENGELDPSYFYNEYIDYLPYTLREFMEQYESKEYSERALRYFYNDYTNNFPVKVRKFAEQYENREDAQHALRNFHNEFTNFLPDTLREFVETFESKEDAKDNLHSYYAKYTNSFPETIREIIKEYENYSDVELTIRNSYNEYTDYLPESLRNFMEQYENREDAEYALHNFYYEYNDSFPIRIRKILAEYESYSDVELTLSNSYNVYIYNLPDTDREFMEQYENKEDAKRALDNFYIDYTDSFPVTFRELIKEYGSDEFITIVQRIIDETETQAIEKANLNTVQPTREETPAREEKRKKENLNTVQTEKEEVTGEEITPTETEENAMAEEKKAFNREDYLKESGRFDLERLEDRIDSLTESDRNMIPELINLITERRNSDEDNMTFEAAVSLLDKALLASNDSQNLELAVSGFWNNQAPFCFSDNVAEYVATNAETPFIRAYIERTNQELLSYVKSDKQEVHADVHLDSSVNAAFKTDNQTLDALAVKTVDYLQSWNVAPLLKYIESRSADNPGFAIENIKKIFAQQNKNLIALNEDDNWEGLPNCKKLYQFYKAEEAKAGGIDKLDTITDLNERALNALASKAEETNEPNKKETFIFGDTFNREDYLKESGRFDLERLEARINSLTESDRDMIPELINLITERRNSDEDNMTFKAAVSLLDKALLASNDSQNLELAVSGFWNNQNPFYFSDSIAEYVATNGDTPFIRAYIERTNQELQNYVKSDKQEVHADVHIASSVNAAFKTDNQTLDALAVKTIDYLQSWNVAPLLKYIESRSADNPKFAVENIKKVFAKQDKNVIALNEDDNWEGLPNCKKLYQFYKAEEAKAGGIDKLDTITDLNERAFALIETEKEEEIIQQEKKELVINMETGDKSQKDENSDENSSPEERNNELPGNQHRISEKSDEDEALPSSDFSEEQNIEESIVNPVTDEAQQTNSEKEEEIGGGEPVTQESSLKEGEEPVIENNSLVTEEQPMTTSQPSKDEDAEKGSITPEGEPVTEPVSEQKPITEPKPELIETPKPESVTEQEPKERDWTQPLRPNGKQPLMTMEEALKDTANRRHNEVAVQNDTDDKARFDFVKPGTTEKEGSVKIENESELTLDSTEFKHFLAIIKTAKKSGHNVIKLGKTSENIDEAKKFAANLVLAGAMERVPVETPYCLEELAPYNSKINILIEKRKIREDLAKKKEAVNASGNDDKAKETYLKAKEDALQHYLDKGTIDPRKEKQSSEECMNHLIEVRNRLSNKAFGSPTPRYERDTEGNVVRDAEGNIKSKETEQQKSERKGRLIQNVIRMDHVIQKGCSK